MGDRFYMQQKNYKPGRRLKKDAIADIHGILDAEVPGLDRMTIPSIDALYDAIYLRLKKERNEST